MPTDRDRRSMLYQKVFGIMPFIIIY